jgi:dTDP-4-dehydrorhamnose reductase
MIKVLVTGANGQLGNCIKDATPFFPQCEFIFASRADLDIENEISVSKFFTNNSFDYCINTAAYTNVEKAESDKEAAYKSNAEGVKLLAEACVKKAVTLIQVSTDYVFDGKKNTPYTENDDTNPINIYGASKLKGEQYIEEFCEKYFIVRTSWLYSQYGHNFLNTIVKHSKAGTALTITTEQVGTPTNANDLAFALLTIVNSNSEKYGIYHYSNDGEATWYDFAKEILRLSNQIENTKLAKTDYYRTFAKRPKYSILNTIKFSKAFDLEIIGWKESLARLINNKIINS